MAAGTEFGLLGSLMVRCDGTAVPVPPGKQRAVLAVLLLNAGRAVPVDEIAEVLWGSAPPPSARVTVRNYVSRLRLVLGELGRDRISTQPRGYLIRVAADELDVVRFEALILTAQAAAREGSWAASGAQARAALALWRGEPLADVQSETLVRVELPRLAELRLQALECRLEADLHLGRQADVIAELSQLGGLHPLREHLRALLMLALYQSGRQAEAFAAYQDAHRVLVEELGVEPGAELRELHQKILLGAPGLAQPGPSSSSTVAEPAASPAQRPHDGSGPAPVPQQLPARGPRFVGRTAELTMLMGLLDRTAAGAGGPATREAPTIVAIGGTAGVGKTALALHFGHLAAAHFPDGQLYLNLRGFDPSGEPMPPAVAVRSFLDTLQVRPELIPAGPDAQAGLYRSLLTSRRMLILLDNAADTDQVRPLLPGGGQCLIVVTSRRQLTGLDVLDGAQALALDLLTDAEAWELLASRLGEARLASDPLAAAELAAECARLPLALSVVAARAQARPRFPLAALASDLRDARGRLDALDGGEEIVNVRAVFSWSYEQLSPGPARMFRLLGLHPGPDITAAAAASLAAVSRAQARRALGRLTSACLLTEHAPGRFAFHDLLRVYAAEQCAAIDDEGDRATAIRQSADHYLQSAWAADQVLYAERRRIAISEPQPGTQPEVFTSHAQALAWFECEHQVLLAMVGLASAVGLDTWAWQLPWTMETFLYRRAHWHDWDATQRAALAAARRIGDREAQAYAHRGIANACIEDGSQARGRWHLAQALRLWEDAGDLEGQARIHLDLARSAGRDGNYEEYVAHARHGLEVARSAGRPAGVGNALGELAWALSLLGDHEQAITLCREALQLFERTNRHVEGTVWDTMGHAYHHLGRHTEAAACYQEAVQILDEVGYSFDKAMTLIAAGEAYRAAGDVKAARDAWRQAYLILDDVDHPAAAKALAHLRDLDTADPDLSNAGLGAPGW